jgi:hypothetical protein
MIQPRSSAGGSPHLPLESASLRSGSRMPPPQASSRSRQGTPGLRRKRPCRVRWPLWYKMITRRCGGGGIGRRKGLKIPRSARTVRVRFPPSAPSSSPAPGDSDYDDGASFDRVSGLAPLGGRKGMWELRGKSRQLETVRQSIVADGAFDGYQDRLLGPA